MLYIITDSNRKWWILAALAICTAVSFIDQTALSVTLPSLQRTFHTSAIALQWVIDIFLLTIAVLVIIGGRLGDLYQHRHLYLIGSIIFLIASILCAIAPNIIWLIISRAIQGIGAAILIPSSTVITLNTFERHERGKAMGMCVGYASLFLAFGPFLGGFFTQIMSWRLVFWINLPLMSIVILIICIAIPHTPSKINNKKLDWIGLIALIIAISTLVIALMEGTNLGWDSNIIISLFITSLIFSSLFYYYEKRIKQPLINFTIFHNKVFSGAAIVFLFLQVSMMIMVFTAIFNQEVLGFKPAIAGLLSLPGTLPIMFMGPIAGRMLDRYGVRRPIIMGLILALIGVTLNGYLAAYQNYLYLLPGLLCNGFGIPLIMSPLGTAAVSSVEHEQQGVASGMIQAMRQLGSCIGLALLSAVIIGYHQRNLAHFIADHKHEYSHLTLHQLTNLLAYPNNSHLNALIPIVKASFSDAYGLGMHVCAIFIITALVIAWCLLKPKEK